MAGNNNFSFFFLGLGIGVAVGVLFAPQSGQETRGLIKNKADEGKDFIKRRSTDLYGQAGNVIEKGRELVSRQKEHLAEAVEAGKQAYRETVSEPAAPGPNPA